MALFVGQIAAALAAGNAVLAKPSFQTQRIAAEAVRLVRATGLDPGLLHLIRGGGELVGLRLVVHPNLDGVGSPALKRVPGPLIARWPPE